MRRSFDHKYNNPEQIQIWYPHGNSQIGRFRAHTFLPLTSLSLEISKIQDQFASKNFFQALICHLLHFSRCSGADMAPGFRCNFSWNFNICVKKLKISNDPRDATFENLLEPVVWKRWNLCPSPLGSKKKLTNCLSKSWIMASWRSAGDNLNWTPCISWLSDEDLKNYFGGVLF